MTQTENEVSRCLRQILKEQSLVLGTIEYPNGLAKGVNFMGEIRQVRIRSRDRNLHLVVKIAPTVPLRRTILTVEAAYRCEAFMYRTVLPRLTEPHVPRFFAASENVLVLEDAAPLRVLAPTSALTYAQARILVCEIGRFHAASLVLRKKNPDVMRTILMGLRQDTREEDMNAWLVSSFLSDKIEDYLGVIDAESRAGLDGFSKKFRVFFDRFYEFDAEDPYGVVGHCDLWPCNLLLDDEVNPQRMCIVDWQTARLCSPGVDLSMILFLCCDDVVRRVHGEDLVKVYYGSCTQWMAAHGEEVSELLPFDVLQTHLKFYGGYAVCLALRTITAISVAKDGPLDTSSANTKEEYLELWKSAKKDHEFFDHRIRNVLVDFLRSGYDTLNF